MSYWTDRVFLASKKIKANIIINVQGDEPVIKSEDIKKIVKEKKKFPNHVICGYTRIGKNESENNINLPKVVLNSKSELVYISRLTVPGKKEKNKKIDNKQVCIYAFSKDQLNKFYKFGKKVTLKN